MRNILWIGIILLLFPIFGLAQTNENAANKHHYLIFGSHISYLNKTDVETQGSKNFLTVHNTTGYQFGISYEYTTKYNINFSILSAYGMQEHDLIWNFTFEDFHPGLDFGNYQDVYRYNKKVPYLNMSVFTGYDYQLLANGKLKLQAKVGIGSIHNLKWDIEDQHHILIYGKGTSPDTVFARQYATTDPESGSPKKQIRNYFYSFYLGLSYPRKGIIIKEYRLGVTYTNALFDAFNISRGFYYNSAGVREGVEIYKNKFQSIGIMASIGF